MRCPRCLDEDCIAIQIALRDDESVQFFLCRLCEAKWWERDGGHVTLDEVLSLAARRSDG